jgi:hemerythrin-like domain-containing protein
MQKRTRSLLEELESVGSNRDINHVIENRANNVITSAINLIELMNRHFDKEKAEILERKLLSSIKSKEPRRFAKSLRKKHED